MDQNNPTKSKRFNPTTKSLTKKIDKNLYKINPEKKNFIYIEDKARI